MLRPLLLMAFAYMTYYAALMLSRARAEILERQAGSAWTRALLNGTSGR
jgi:heme exporter protein C